MPIYGYACDSCEHRFDALQKMSDPKLVECPECGEHSLRKQLSAPKFRLKGQGWYETDFKTGDKRNLAADSNSKDDNKSKDDSKSDTKSAESGKGAAKDAGKTSKKAAPSSADKATSA